MHQFQMMFIKNTYRSWKNIQDITDNSIDLLKMIHKTSY